MSVFSSVFHDSSNIRGGFCSHEASWEIGAHAIRRSGAQSAEAISGSTAGEEGEEASDSHAVRIVHFFVFPFIE
jgi:hypothetical protein